MQEKEAKIIYKDGDYEILVYGHFVRCAVTGEKIALDDLKYWSVLKQEAYKDCDISLRRELGQL